MHRSDPGLMLGYWRRPDEEAQVFRGEWFVGGDLGSIDDDGYVTHLGRSNELMNAGGYRVSPQEVEAALARCPGVSRSRVHGNSRAQRRLGHRRVRRARRRHGARRGGDQRLSRRNTSRPTRCRAKLFFVDRIPRTANGKVQRKALAAKIAEKSI